MQPANSSQSDQQQTLARREDNVVRILGRYFGRVIATIAAAIAMRLIRKRYATENQDVTEAEISTARILEEVKNDASIAAASVFAWNINLGGPTGADISEFMVDRVSNFSTQSFSETPIFPKSTTTVAERVTDSLLWRFANYAAATVPEVRSVLQGPPSAPRQEGVRFYF